MLCDLPGVLSFLGLPPETEMPPGNKGKTKLKKLYRKVAPNKAYHSGERAKDLISHLDMAEIGIKARHAAGQRGGRVVLQDAEKGIGEREELWDEGRGQAGHLQVHRALLQ